jgi:nucleoside 2-deoxyribosyltransferase
MNGNSVVLEDVAQLLHIGLQKYQSQICDAINANSAESQHSEVVEWNELGTAMQNQYRFIAAHVVGAWSRGGLAPSDFKAAIHNAWALSISALGGEHVHAVPYHQAHIDGPAEHAIQSELITEYLANCNRMGRYTESERTCLALLPFRQNTLTVYDDVIESAISKSGFVPIRADKLRGAKSIHDEVIDQIERCTVVVADLSDDNPNVNYEIGMARSLGKPIVMVSSNRDPTSVPFYYKGQRVHFYDQNDEDWRSKLSEYIQLSVSNSARLDPLSENQKIGLTGLFLADNMSFESELKRQITLTSSRIVAVGWGLAFLNRQRREVMDVLQEQVRTQPNLTVHIILARPDHPGLVERIKEEEELQPRTGILTDWQHEFFKFALELPQSLEGDESRERVFVRRLHYLPTGMAVLLDDVVFIRFYGPPNTGGWQSPWLRCQKSLATREWVGFLDNFIDQAVENSFEP